MSNEKWYSKISRYFKGLFLNVKAVVCWTFVAIIGYSLILNHKMFLALGIFGLVFSIINYFSKE